MKSTKTLDFENVYTQYPQKTKKNFEDAAEVTVFDAILNAVESSMNKLRLFWAKKKREQ